MKIKLLQELNPSPRTLKAISSTHLYKIQITSGKINVLEPTNIKTIIPIRYLLFYRTKIIELYEYPEDHVKENNFINHQTKQTFNKNADEFLNDLMLSLREGYKGFEYKQIKDMETLLTLYENYNSISIEDYLNNTNNMHEDHKEIINNLVANQGVLVASIIIDNSL